MKLQQLAACLVLLQIPVAIGQQISPPAVKVGVQIVQTDPGTCPSEEEWQAANAELSQEAFRLLDEQTCGGTRGWKRVAFVNMTDTSQECPLGLALTSFSKRTCGSTTANSQVGRCDSTTFSVNATQYSRVCGRVIGYKYFQTAAFFSYYGRSQTTVEGYYVDGISLTHGAEGQRQHIWTFAGSLSDFDDGSQSGVSFCACAAINPVLPPPFVGDDYFCESGTNDPTTANIPAFYPDDPLWDGQNCGPGPTGEACCEFNNPPWFTKTLPSPTTDDIELRLCSNSHFHSNTPLELIELYIQ